MSNLTKKTLLSLLLFSIALAPPVADSAKTLDLVNPLVAPGSEKGPTARTSPSGSGLHVVVGPTTGIHPIGPGPKPIVFVGPPAVAGPSSDHTAQKSPVGPGSNTSPAPPSLSFFMHNILGGSHPSARVVTGLVTPAPETTGIPFSKPHKSVFPLPGGVPLPNGSNQRPSPSRLNGGHNQPFVTAGDLPSDATLRRLVFGSVTAIDDEITEGAELGSSVIGTAQGFYFASSSDGTSHTIALTILLQELAGEKGGAGDRAVEDTISFFGVHRTASPESQIAVVGGTGKYEKARGYAAIKSLENRENDHTTDGADGVIQFDVFLAE